MTLIVFVSLLALMTVYFCLDRGHRIDRNGIGRGLVYPLFPVLSGAAICIGLISSSMGDRYAVISDIFSMIVQVLGVMAVTVVSAIGSISVIKYERSRTDAARSRRLLKIALFSSVLSAVSAAAAAVFCCITSVQAVHGIAVGILSLIFMTIFLTFLTFGIGLVIMGAVIPIFAIISAADTVVGILPYAVSALVCAGIFFILHISTVAYAIAAIYTLYKECRIDKNSAVKYGILSAVPCVNVFAVGRFMKKSGVMKF